MNLQRHVITVNVGPDRRPLDTTDADIERRIMEQIFLFGQAKLELVMRPSWAHRATDPGAS